MSRCSRRSSFVGLGSARRPRYSTSSSASGAADAEQGTSGRFDQVGARADDSPGNAAGAQSGARGFRLSQHRRSQRSDYPPDRCPEPERQEQYHDQRRYSDQLPNGSTEPQPIVCGVSALQQNSAIQHLRRPPVHAYP